jgi:cation transport protein ChaC
MTRCNQTLFEHTLSAWGGHSDLWVFAYASLIWRPEGNVVETRPAQVHGYHRALQMWSRVNRGTPAQPGLVFALISGGCCKGVVQRIARDEVPDYLHLLWQREMPNPVYDPRWLQAKTPQGEVRALGFTLSRRSPSFTGHLSPDTYRRIFSSSVGRYGSTLDYAHQTHTQLRHIHIHDRALGALLALAPAASVTPDIPPLTCHTTATP